MVVTVRQDPQPDAQFTATAPAAAKRYAETAEREANEALIIAESFPIETAADYEAATEELKKAKAEWAKLEARRVEITGPLNAAVKSVNDLFRPPLTLWKRIEDAIKERAKPYLRALREAEERAERERQEALRKLAAQEERAAEKGQDARVADIQARTAVVASAPSAVERPVVSGVSSRTKWTYEVLDETRIPQKYFVLDHAKIGKEVRALGRDCNIPGIKVIEDLTISSRRG